MKEKMSISSYIQSTVSYSSIIIYNNDPFIPFSSSLLRLYSSSRISIIPPLLLHYYFYSN